MSAGRGTYWATGLGGGFFSGLTGVGGGAVMVPLLTGVLKMRQHTAHGTSLVVIIFAAAASAIVYEAREGVAWALVASLLPASLVGAYAGARFVQRIPALRLRQVFGGFVFLVALRLLAFGDVGAAFGDVSGAREVAAASLIGMIGGLISGALGVGGGAILVPGMVLLLGTDQHDAQGVSLCVIAAAAIVGAATHARHGSVDMRAASWIAPLAVPAGMLGALVASWLDGRTLQLVFATVLLAVGVQMVTTASLALRRSARLRGSTAESVEAAA